MKISLNYAFVHFAVLGYVLLCLGQSEGKFVEVPKEEITPPPVTASTDGWRPLLPTTEKVSVPAGSAQRPVHYRQSVTTTTPYVSVHPVLGKLHAHLETAERNKRLHQQHLDIYTHTPPSILGSFTVFGHATVKSRNKPPKKIQTLDSDTSETRLTAAGRLIPPPVPHTISLTRFPADNNPFKFGFDAVDKHRQTYYLPLPQTSSRDAAFQFLSPPKTENKYYYTSVGEFPHRGSAYGGLGATQILAPLPQSQYISPGSISHSSTKFGNSDIVRFLPQSTDIQVSAGGGGGGATPKPQQVYVHPPRVQDVPQVAVTPSTHQVFGRIQETSPNGGNTNAQVYVHPGRVEELVPQYQNVQISTGTPSPHQAFVNHVRAQEYPQQLQEVHTTPSPQQVTFVHQGRVQDVSVHNSQQSLPSKETSAFSVYQRKKNKYEFETTTASVPKWSPEDPYRANLAHQSSGSINFRKDSADNVGSVLSQLLDGRILPGSTPLTFDKEEEVLPTTTLPPQEVPKKGHYPTQQVFPQVPSLLSTAEKPRIARPYFEQDRTIRNEAKIQRKPQYEIGDDELIPPVEDSSHTSLNVNKEPSPTNPEVRTIRKPLKPLLPTPLTEQEVEEVEEQEYATQSILEEEQNEIRTHPPRRPNVRPRLPPPALEENEKPRERPYRPRRPVTRRPVTDSYEEDTGSRPAFSQREPSDDNTRRERWRTSTNRPERNRYINRYTEQQSEGEYYKQKRRRRPSHAPQYEDELTTVPADYHLSAAGNEDTTIIPTTPVNAKPNRGRERHRNRLPPVERRVVPTSATPATAPAEEEHDYEYHYSNHDSQSTSSNLFDEPHTLNEVYESGEFTPAPTTTTTSSPSSTTTTPTTTTSTSPEPTTIIMTTSTSTTEPTTTSAALRIKNRYRYRANSTRPRFSVKDYKERLTKLSSIANSNPEEEPQNENHDPETTQENEEIRNQEEQELSQTSAQAELPGSFDIMKDEETKDDVTSPSALASTRVRQQLRTRGSYHYSSTTSTTTEPTTRSRYRQHSRYNPSLRSRYSTSSTTTTEPPAAVSTSTERVNLFRNINRHYRPGLKYSRYRTSTDTPAEESPSTDQEPSSTTARNNPYRKPYPLRSRYSARVTSTTEKTEDSDTASSDVTEVGSSDTLKTTAPVMSEKIDTTTSDSQEVVDGTTGGSVSTTTSVIESNSATDLPTFAPAYHDDQENLSQRIADLTSSASSAGYFRTMAPPQRTNLRITMATDDPILPIEAFFPIRSSRGDNKR